VLNALQQARTDASAEEGAVLDFDRDGIVLLPLEELTELADSGQVRTRPHRQRSAKPISVRCVNRAPRDDDDIQTWDEIVRDD